VDSDNRVEGVISLSDILNYLVKEDRHLSDSFSGVSCSEDECFLPNGDSSERRTSSESDDVALSMSDLVIDNCSTASAAGDEKMDVFPAETLEAV